MTIINAFIGYRYYRLSQIEKETYVQIKKAFGEEELYICKGNFVVFDNESEAELCVGLGNYMLSSSEINIQGFYLACFGAILTAIAAVSSILPELPPSLWDWFNQLVILKPR